MSDFSDWLGSVNKRGDSDEHYASFALERGYDKLPWWSDDSEKRAWFLLSDISVDDSYTSVANKINFSVSNGEFSPSKALEKLYWGIRRFSREVFRKGESFSDEWGSW